MSHYDNNQSSAGHHQYQIEIDEDDAGPMPSSSYPGSEVLKSTVVERKGRGFSSATIQAYPPSSPSTLPAFESITAQQAQQLAMFADYDPRTHAQRSMEGWTLFITGLHPEQSEDDLKDAVGDAAGGVVKEVRMPLDHRTGFVKGYALVDFQSFSGAKQVVELAQRGQLNNLGKTLGASWAFLTEPIIQ